VRNLALEIADLKGVVLNFADGVADAYDSDSLSTTTSATYDSSNDFYSPATPSATLIDRTDGTIIGDFDTQAANAFDGNTSQDRGNSASNTTTGNPNSYIGKDFGSGVTETIVGASWQGPTGSDSVGSTDSITFYLYVSNSAPTSYNDGTLLGTIGTENNGSAAQLTSKTDFVNTTGYRYAWIHGAQSGSGVETYVAEVKFYSIPAGDMTLINTAYTASSAPNEAYVTVQADPVDSITINTDLTAEVSRDNGTTYSTVTLSAGGTNAGFISYTGTVDISGQPSGTSMLLRIKTLNGKDIDVSGQVLRWA
jgi:hypothetical protein